MNLRCCLWLNSFRLASGQMFLTLLLGCARPSAADEKLWEQVSGEKALANVQAVVDYGPRPAGSEALEKSRKHIEEQLRASGWAVNRQTFTDQTPRGIVTFVNLVAVFPTKRSAKAKPVFLLCSHYDTKLFDDITFVGANDAG